MEYTRKRFSIPSTKSWYRRFSNSFSHITGQNTTFGRNRILPKVAALVGVGISSHWAFWALCLSVVRYFRGAKVLIEVGALISFAYLCTYWVSCVYQKKIEKLSAEIKQPRFHFIDLDLMLKSKSACFLLKIEKVIVKVIWLYQLS